MADKGRHRGNDLLLVCDSPIDQPGLLIHDELLLTGWAASPHDIAGVAVRIDDDRWLQASYGLDTPWVAEAIPEMPGADAAGYELRLETSEWAPGTHAVEVLATDGRGRHGTIAGQVQVVPFERPRYTVEDNLAAISEGKPVMWLEQPRIVDGTPELSGTMEVSGWAYSPTGIESVVLTVDRRARYEALRPISRADLLADYGAAVAGDAGFALRLDPTELKPGRHSVSVVAVAGDGRAVGVEGEVVSLSPPPEATGQGEPLRIEWMAEREAPRLRERGGVPGADQLLEAERELRQRWADLVARGKEVLHAGSGGDPETDLGNLHFEDASFDLVTCLDALHEAADPDVALAELQRILRPDGLLLASVPQLRVSRAAGHTPPALTPKGLERSVRDRFGHIAVFGQQTYLASVLDERERRATEGDKTGLEVHAAYPARAGEEVHTLIAASAQPLPELQRLAVLASPQPVRDALTSALMWEDRARLAEADAAASRTEANLAQMHQKGAVGRLREVEAQLRDVAAIEASLSWRITRPLRLLKRWLSSLGASK